MPDLPSVSYASLQDALQSAVSAHQAVSEGIGTHAQREAARKDKRRRELEAQNRLEGKGGISGR
jgi:hypothetical protein